MERASIGAISLVSRAQSSLALFRAPELRRKQAVSVSPQAAESDRFLSPICAGLEFDHRSHSHPRKTAPMRAGQHGCLSAFAGMTPVAMATATACVKFMQLNLWRAVSR